MSLTNKVNSASFQIARVVSVPTEKPVVEILLKNYRQLLMERVIIDAKGKEINGRLSEILKSALSDAQKNQKEGESLNDAILRNALKRLNSNPNKYTLGGLPTGPAYERAFPNNVPPSKFGHEKVNYPMSDYSSLSFMPVGGLGAPLKEVDSNTSYFKEGHMVQDKIEDNILVRIGEGKAQKTYDLSKEKGTYYALYPISERNYNLDVPVSIVQFSPVIPGNYKESSYPVEMIELNAENTTDKPIKITFVVTRENILGWYPKEGKDNPKDPNGVLVWEKQSDNNISQPFEDGSIKGIIFKKDVNQKDFVRVGNGVAGQIVLVSEEINGKVKIKAVINKKSATGKSEKKSDEAMLEITVTLNPGEKIKHPVAVAYDTPFYNLQYKATDPKSPGVRMPKFYTRFYGDTGENAKKIASDALNNYDKLKQKIVDFQKKITDDPELPDFFKQALINELYVLAETGIWEAGEGRFAYLESIDYKMYNTSDVNSYTWALLTLFPELERKDLLELSNLISLEDPRMRWFGTDRWANIPPKEWKHLYWGPIKDKGAVPHDLGGLFGEGVFPFTNSANEFNWSNANMWIDLAPKYALRVWRYYTFMQKQKGIPDLQFIKTVYPSVKMALDTLERRWADKKTHVPISKGIPDWTYDTISGKGYTPNIVTQWIAALDAAHEMAILAGDKETAQKYESWRSDAKEVLSKLWNEKGYYNAFVSVDGKSVNDNVHSDMGFGDFYARMSGLTPVIPNDKAKESLNTIYQNNGVKWSSVGAHGPLGLANLRGPNGEQNKTEQGDEGWTGTMLLNAAYQIKVGKETNNQELIDNGWNIVHGFFNVVYSGSPDSQHWFGRTPEGYANPDDQKYDEPNKKYKEGKVLPDGTTAPATGRAPKYMRALAIWAIYAALKNNKMPFNIYGEKIPDRPDNFNKPFGRNE